MSRESGSETMIQIGIQRATSRGEVLSEWLGVARWGNETHQVFQNAERWTSERGSDL